MNLIFKSESDAVSVAEQLYNFESLDNILIAQSIDFRALELAVNLAGVKFPSLGSSIVDEEAPKIYVACLSAYSNGYLHGIWIDATKKPEDILDNIKWMLLWSPVRDLETCEEWAIHDYKNWQGIKLDEHEDIEKVAEIAQMLEKHSEAYAVYYQHYGSDASEEDFQDRYLGKYEDEKDFVYQMWDECGTLKKLEELGINESYIDWKAIARDRFIDSYFSVEVGYKETYVFSRH